jgi:flagellar basal body-associated protein FliL
MKRSLLILSIVTPVLLGAAIAGQVVVVTQGITYTPDGQPTNPTPMATIATFMAAAGAVLSIPLCLAAFVLGLVAMGERKQAGWIATLVAAGLLAVAGLFGMAWVLLSANSPIPLVAPLGLVALVTLLYSLRRD